METQIQQVSLANETAVLLTLAAEKLSVGFTDKFWENFSRAYNQAQINGKASRDKITEIIEAKEEANNKPNNKTLS